MQNANKTRGTGILGGAGMVAQWGAPSLVKSIQRGTCAAGGTVTIAAVDVNNSIITFGGNLFSAANDTKTYWFMFVTLTNATTVSAGAGTAAGTQNATFEVIEFLPGVLKSVQDGTITLGAATSATATITAVEPTKAVLAWRGGYSGDAAGGYLGGQGSMCHNTLTNSTTVTATRIYGGTAGVAQLFRVVEFF